MKEMMWQRNCTTGDASLFYRDHTTNDQFVIYTRHPMAKRDYEVKGGTRGYATMQVLLAQGYRFIDQSSGIPYDDKL